MNRTKRRYLRQARLRRNLYFPFRGKGSYSENLSRKKKKKKLPSWKFGPLSLSSAPRQADLPVESPQKYNT